MKRRYIVLLVTAAFMVLLLILHIGRRPPDPEFEGQHLSDLFKTVGGQESRRRGTYVEKPIRAIGTNAIPYLVRELRLRDSSLRRELISFLDEKNLNLLGMKTKASRQAHALMVCQILGHDAADALPEIIEILETTPDQVVRINALEALGEIGPVPSSSNAVATLMTVLITSSDAFTRYRAASLLGQMGSQAKQAIPLLRRSLTNQSATLRLDPDIVLDGAREALISLGDITNDIPAGPQKSDPPTKGPTL